MCCLLMMKISVTVGHLIIICITRDLLSIRFFLRFLSCRYTDDDEVVRACWSVMRCLEFALVKDFGSGIHNIGTVLVCADNDWSMLIID